MYSAVEFKVYEMLKKLLADSLSTDNLALTESLDVDVKGPTTIEGDFLHRDV